MRLSILVAITLLMGCTTTKSPVVERPPTSVSQVDRSAVPLLGTKHTVDDVLKMLAAGKRPDDIRPLLGIPMISVMRAKYLLKDGWISTDFQHYMINDGSHKVRKVIIEQKDALDKK